jgi:hypothetical protein
VPGRVLEIDAASAVLGVDLPGLGHVRVSPVFDPGCDQALVGPVEVRVVDQEGIVLHLDLYGRLGELQHHAAAQADVDERPPGGRVVRLQDRAVERGGCLAVPRGDDGVIERGGHEVLSWRDR